MRLADTPSKHTQPDPRILQGPLGFAFATAEAAVATTSQRHISHRHMNQTLTA